MSKSDAEFAGPIVSAAIEVAQAVSARALFVYTDAAGDIGALLEKIKEPTQLVLVCRNADDEKVAENHDVETLSVPPFSLTRMGQIKMATLIAFSRQLLKPSDVFVFLTGVVGRGIDTFVVMQVGEEYELFHAAGQPKLTEHIRRPVFERVLRIALELAHEGREGKPVGALFVIGDHREVQKYSQEGRINPFKGYTERERNIIDESMGDTVKEIAKLDGAFVIKGNGVIISACATLRPAATEQELSQGLGSRHAAAAGITAVTKSIAISLSESTGDVRVWRRGTMITEIEKSLRSGVDIAPPKVTE